MSLIESNSTKLLLAPNAVFQGKALKPDVKYITIQITASFTGGNSGLLEIFYSIDGIYYDTYGDSWTYTTETNEAHIFKETQMKGSYFYVKWTNNGISQYTTFNLNTKLTTTTSTVSVDGVINIPTVSVDINGQTVFSKIKDSNGNVLNSSDGSLYVYDVSSYLKLVDINNTIQNKTLSKTTSSIDISGQRVVSDISGQRVVTDISGQRVDISGQRVDISGQIVDISGQRVVTDISGQRVDISGQRVVTDISGQRLVTDISGQRVDISGQRVVTDISGQRIDISGQRIDISGQTVRVSNLIDISGLGVDISGQRVDISGQRVVTDISGQRVVTDISGQRVVTDISGQTVDISGQRVVTDISGQRVDISGQRVDISGQRVVTDISGQRVDISGQRVDISGQRVDISGQMIDISGQRVDISGQRVITDISGQRVITDISGQRVDISGQRVDISGQRILVDISGQRMIVDISGQRVDISGQKVVVDISGQRINISGQGVDISGQWVNVSNMISNYALENGNLASIKTNTDKFKFTGDDLKTTITNPLLTVETGTNALDVNITGGTITGANGKAYLYSGDEATSITATTISTKNGIDSNIINTSLDVHCYASSNGSTFHHLSSDSNGQLNVHSKLQDGAGTDLTSTLNGSKQSLDVNLTNNNSIDVDISGVGLNGDKLKVDVSGQHVALDAQLFSLSTGYSPHVLTCSYTDFYDQQYSLDTASAICTTGFDINGGLRRRELTGKDIVYKTSTSPDNRYALDTTSYIATKGANLTTDPTYMTSTTVNSKNGLDVNVVNNTVKVDISGSTIVEGKLIVVDSMAYPYIQRISAGAGADINYFTFGNFYNNITINSSAFSTPGDFIAGNYGRKAMLFYRDSATSSTDSVSFYTNSNFGTSTPLFVATTYPIVNGSYRWSTIILNVLCFSNLYIRNDSATINNTGVYLTMIAT